MSASSSKMSSSTNSSSKDPMGTQVKKKKPEDFKFGREIGHGSFSTVYLARDVESGMEFAIKVLEKQNVLRHKATKTAVWMERHVLQTSDHPLVARLVASFHDALRLYFVLPYAPYGELLHWLHKAPNGCFDVETVRFYTSELLLALEYLHSKQIVHRDIKPENMLIGPELHLMLVDFGSAIVVDNPEIKAVSFTGTAHFVSPEMLGGLKNIIMSASAKETASASSSSSDGSRSQNGEDASPQDSGASATADEGPVNELMYLMDFWAFGCVLFQLLSGKMPFQNSERHSSPSDAQEIELFHKVIKVEYVMPDNFPDEAAKDMVTRLLVADPTRRLGNPEDDGHTALKRHNFFSSIDWDSDTLLDRPPPKSMLNLVRSSKLGSSVRSSSSNSASSENDNAEKSAVLWSNVPIGFEACQRYLWEKEVHTNALVENFICVEKPRPEKSAVERPQSDEPVVDIEGGALVRYLVDNGICLSPKNVINMPRKEVYLARQRANNTYDQFTQGRLILDYGILYKRRKLRAKKRMFLMVEDIRLLYVDPDAMELKGIVRLSALSTFEVRNSKTFLIRTPGRDYILEDPSEGAQEWVERVRRYWSLFFSSPT